MSYFLMIENRHLAEWRFSLFTLMVITNPRICKVKVIGIASPPFGWCGRPPTVYGVTLVDPIISNRCCICQVKYADPYEETGIRRATARVAPTKNIVGVDAYIDPRADVGIPCPRCAGPISGLRSELRKSGRCLAAGKNVPSARFYPARPYEDAGDRKG